MHGQSLVKLSAIRCAIAVALTGTLVGCNSQSEDYETLRELPPDEWVAFASSLPIERRLDLHIEVQSSSHNPPHTIVDAFNQDPQKAYQSLVGRIRSGDTNRHYARVVFEIERSPSFSICEQPDRQIVQNYLWKIATNAVRPEDRPDFYRC